MDRTFVLGSDRLYREWGYVALSRGRTSNQLYVPPGCRRSARGGPRAAARRELPTVRFGRRLIVPTGRLLAMLGLDGLSQGELRRQH